MHFTIYGIFTWMKYDILLSFLESLRVTPWKYGHRWDSQPSVVS